MKRGLDLLNQWEIHEHVRSTEVIDRRHAVNQLCDIFTTLPDKQQAWKDLHQLTHDTDSYVQGRAAEVLGAAFSFIPYKQQAWEDLHRLAQDMNSYVRRQATEALGAAFSSISDKQLAWEDLHQLMQDMDSYVRERAVDAVDLIFSDVPDRRQAWTDLHRLTEDWDSEVRWRTAIALGSSFSYIPNKRQALTEDDLNRLTHDEDSVVRRGAADALGFAFSYLPEKEQAWKNLIRLTCDEDNDVRASANYSVGKASIFNANEAQNEKILKEQLETAIDYFENSMVEAVGSGNPARFCLPFYRSFSIMLFKEQFTDAEIRKYLAEAKSVCKGSSSKEKLLKAVENLSNALKEAQKTKEIDFNSKKNELNAYRQYCERAADLLRFTEEKAPGATKLIRKGLPIIDQKIKELLGEIEEKARKFCTDSRETPFEKISRNAYEHVKGLGETENPIKAEISLNGLAPLLRSMCRILPEESREVICSQLDEMKEAELLDKARIIGSALSSIQPQIINLQEKLAERERWIEYFKNIVIQRLDNINYGVFQLKIRSGEIVPTLYEIQDELKKLIIIKTDLDNIGLNIKDLGDLQHYDIQKLNDGLTLLCRKIETEIIPKLPKASDAQRIIEIQKKIEDLKQSKEEIWFNRVAGLSSIVGLILTIL